ncbi:hypothetical protein [Chryseobacterium sp. sg2396]|nr:hypothetical protein [uncultured Chryseobacterium sp.]
MKIRSFFYMGSLLLLTGVATIQCRNNNGEDEDAINENAQTIYAAGRENYKAKYWKNGTGISLGKSAGSSEVMDIAIAGNDVYTVGYEANAAGKYVARYWKNGVAVDLTDGSRDAFANGIFISGNDVYIAGQELKPGESTYAAKYWKNGVPVVLAGDSENAIASGIALVGSDVYVIGERRMQNSLTPVTCYWKNGQRSDLSDQTTTASEQDITVSGNDVYMMWSVAYNSSGQLQTRYSKNLSAPVLIQDGTPEVGGTSIAVKDNDVYIAGTGLSSTGQSFVSKYWKNGLPVSIGQEGSFGLGICLFGNDIYISGYQQVQGGGTVATYWKNGKAQQLTGNTGNGLLRQIIVKEQ